MGEAEHVLAVVTAELQGASGVGRELVEGKEAMEAVAQLEEALFERFDIGGARNFATPPEHASYPVSAKALTRAQDTERAMAETEQMQRDIETKYRQDFLNRPFHEVKRGEDWHLQIMRVTDLPQELLEQVLANLSNAALGRVIRTCSALTPAAVTVASLRFDANPALIDNGFDLRLHASEMEVCSECWTTTGMKARSASYKSGRTYIRVCNACASDSGGFRETIPYRDAKGIANDKFTQLRDSGDMEPRCGVTPQAGVVVKGCQRLYKTKGRPHDKLWAREFERMLDHRLKCFTRSPRRMLFVVGRLF